MASLDAMNTLQGGQGEECSLTKPFDVPDESGKKPGNILIVDPAAAQRRHMAHVLGDVAGIIHESSSTSEGLSVMRQHGIDLVLLDLRAPELGAADFCRQVREMPGMRFVQIFVLAQSDNLESEVGTIDAGANEFLVAPLRDRALHARVRSNLRNKEMVDLLDDSETVLFSLAKSLEERDPDLSIHCQRLSIMAAVIGVALQLPPRDIITLQRGGYLHDIGKISIPDRVLFKPGPLTPEEWEIMKSHTLRGETICAGVKSLRPVLPIIRSHHERWDGLGYPDGLRGHQIPLLARILQLADIFDALTMVRPYKAAVTPEEALAVIREETAKGWRDPELVRVFADIVPLFGTQSLPDLSSLSLNALALSVESFRKVRLPG